MATIRTRVTMPGMFGQPDLKVTELSLSATELRVCREAQVILAAARDTMCDWLAENGRDTDEDMDLALELVGATNDLAAIIEEDGKWKLG